jgi:hypothetical protein
VTTEQLQLNVVRNDWSFAASAEDVRGLRRALAESSEYNIRTKVLSVNATTQIREAVASIAEVLETGLWGVGPFSVTVTGSEDSLFVSVKQR